MITVVIALIEEIVVVIIKVFFIVHGHVQVDLNKKYFNIEWPGFLETIISVSKSKPYSRFLYIEALT